MDFGLFGKVTRQHAPQPERIITERRPHPLLSGRSRVAFVEDQIDHRQHRFKPLPQLHPTRSLKGNMSLSQRLLGSKNSLAQSLLRNQEGSGNLGRGEAAGHAQGERNAPFECQHRMAGGKDKAQDVVIDNLIQSLIHSFTEALLLEFQVSPQLSVLPLQHSAAAQSVNGPPLRCRHEPRSGFVGNTLLWPIFESGDQRILSEFLGNADVTGNAGDPGDEACGLNLPHRLNRPVNVAHAAVDVNHVLAGAAFRKVGRALRRFRRVFGEILEIPHLPHLDNIGVGRRCTPRPFDCFFARAHLDDPVAADGFLGLGEWPIRNRGLAVFVRNTRPGRWGKQSIAREQYARFTQVLVVFHHFGGRLQVWDCVRRCCFVPLGDHHHHESHLSLSS